MSGRPPKPPREAPLDKGKLLQELRENLEAHRASTEREAEERRSGRRMADRKSPQRSGKTPPGD